MIAALAIAEETYESRHGVQVLPQSLLQGRTFEGREFETLVELQH
jgi:hypothetical protein